MGGHSRGAAIASRFALLHGEFFNGLILIGTTHPKEEAFDLSTSTLAVTKVYATNDGLASVDEVKANSQFLPEDTNWVLIEGGNHSQFGYYGSQLGDNSATISREVQQKLTVEAVLSALKSIQERQVNSIALQKCYTANIDYYPLSPPSINNRMTLWKSISQPNMFIPLLPRST